MMHFDAIIIGTGQAGPSLDAGFSAAGKTVAIIERYCCHLARKKRLQASTANVKPKINDFPAPQWRNYGNAESRDETRSSHHEVRADF
jgi:choline dehydrogenase-like flavoprotein